MAKKYYSLALEGTAAEVYIFGDITSIPLIESDVSSYGLVEELSRLNADKIDVHINSYGGEVAEALAIYNTLKRSPAQVTTYVDGFACSAATIVFMAGDRRIMSKVGNFLVHPAWALTSGNAEDLRKEADDLDRITEQSITAYMEAVTRSRDELVELMSEERFMTPDEVLDWGFATEIEGADETEAPAQSVRVAVHDMLTVPHSAREELDLSDDAVEKVAAAIFEMIKAEIPKEDPPEEPINEAPETRCFFDAFKK